MAELGKTDPDVFADFLREAVNNYGTVTCTYAKTIGNSGPRTGTRKPNNCLIRKLLIKGVLQRLMGKRGVYGLTSAWVHLIENPAALRPIIKPDDGHGGSLGKAA